MTPAPITFEHPPVGTIRMPGVGPWRQTPANEIVDSTGASANPTVTRPFGANGRGLKANASVVWASRGITFLIVEAANAKLAEQQEAI